MRPTTTPCLQEPTSTRRRSPGSAPRTSTRRRRGARWGPTRTSRLPSPHPSVSTPSISTSSRSPRRGLRSRSNVIAKLLSLYYR